ncbi:MULTISPECIES: nitroreductase/quinone reductase family protein [Mycobacterium ulcerans group]|uniref:nitroreductase/quinone reductase family protein n=1 Tax=Mycobacterium ulcerans group TaxID=2993898 RepID=UPI001EE777F5|nr:nitroreductase/quinone reductase family protein [Mycobacterium ulcerans]
MPAERERAVRQDTTSTSPVRRAAIQVLAGAGLLLVVLEAFLIVSFRLRLRPAINAIRRFNRAVLNPAMLTMAGSAHWYASVIHHQGRTTGRAYATPVVAERVGDQFYIPLPYGRTDWCANVMAAGECTVEHKGRRYRTTAPAVIGFAVAAPFISARSRRTFRLYKVRSFLRLDITDKA